MSKYIITTVILLAFFFFQINRTPAQIGTDNPQHKITSSNIDLSDFVREIYDLYHTDEVLVKQERLVYKKLDGLLNNTFTMKITCSDSIAYDKKAAVTTVKSKEVYHDDNKNGYFGVFVIVQKPGDDLLMNATPDKEITITGTVTDVIVISYRIGLNWFKCRTSLNDFNDTGTIINQIILKIQA